MHSFVSKIKLYSSIMAEQCRKMRPYQKKATKKPLRQFSFPNFPLFLGGENGFGETKSHIIILFLCLLLDFFPFDIGHASQWMIWLECYRIYGSTCNKSLAWRSKCFMPTRANLSDSKTFARLHIMRFCDDENAIYFVLVCSYAISIASNWQCSCQCENTILSMPNCIMFAYLYFYFYFCLNKICILMRYRTNDINLLFSKSPKTYFRSLFSIVVVVWWN